MEKIDNQARESFYDSFGEDSQLIRDSFVLLFKEEKQLFFTIKAKDEDVLSKVRSKWNMLKEFSGKQFKVESLSYVKEAEIEDLFISKLKSVCSGELNYIELDEADAS